MKPNIYWIVLSAVILILTGSPLGAEQKPLKKMKSVPRLDIKQSRKTSVVGEYHGRGVIDAVNEKSVVINDSVFSLSGRIRIQYADGRSFSGRLKPGTAVFYYLEGAKKIVTIFIND
jgi:hypothetical protein